MREVVVQVPYNMHVKLSAGDQSAYEALKRGWDGGETPLIPEGGKAVDLMTPEGHVVKVTDNLSLTTTATSATPTTISGNDPTAQDITNKDLYNEQKKREH